MATKRWMTDVKTQGGVSQGHDLSLCRTPVSLDTNVRWEHSDPTTNIEGCLAHIWRTQRTYSGKPWPMTLMVLSRFSRRTLDTRKGQLIIHKPQALHDPREANFNISVQSRRHVLLHGELAQGRRRGRWYPSIFDDRNSRRCFSEITRAPNDRFWYVVSLHMDRICSRATD